MVEYELIQFDITSRGTIEFFFLAMSVKEMYVFSSIIFPIMEISVPLALIFVVLPPF